MFDSTRYIILQFNSFILCLSWVFSDSGLWLKEGKKPLHFFPHFGYITKQICQWRRERQQRTKEILWVSTLIKGHLSVSISFISVVCLSSKVQMWTSEELFVYLRSALMLFTLALMNHTHKPQSADN